MKPGRFTRQALPRRGERCSGHGSHPKKGGSAGHHLSDQIDDQELHHKTGLDPTLGLLAKNYRASRPTTVNPQSKCSATRTVQSCPCPRMTI
jgi:hypothetical protein